VCGIACAWGGSPAGAGDTFALHIPALESSVTGDLIGCIMKLFDLLTDIFNSLSVAIVLILVVLAVALVMGWVDVDTLMGWLFRAPSF